jgi:hypothetical protein
VNRAGLFAAGNAAEKKLQRSCVRNPPRVGTGLGWYCGPRRMFEMTDVREHVCRRTYLLLDGDGQAGIFTS